MIVCKFGGTSVGSVEAIRQLVSILQDPDHKGRVRVVVVSAFSKVTDTLIAIARKAEQGNGTFKDDVSQLFERHREVIYRLLPAETQGPTEGVVRSLIEDLERILEGVARLGELSNRTLDMVMSFGERLSASIIAPICTAAGMPADYLDARLVIRTDDRFGNARFIPEETYPAIRSLLQNRPHLQIATGFIGATLDGKTTTLGRGGSDLSAAIFGAAIGAEEIEIWTDVDGILTSDPRLVPTAFRMDSISYEEALELSHFGAKVLHPPTVLPAMEKGIPIRIRNTFNPSCPGTLIAREVPPSPYPVRGISSLREVALIRLEGTGMVGVAGFSARLFSALARRHINVILITQASSEYSICCAVLPKDAPEAAAAIKEEFESEIARSAIEPPVIDRDLSIIAVVGSRMKSTPGIAGKVFHALGRNGVNVVAIAQGSSELNISAVISRQDEAKALNAIHDAFFLAGLRSVNLFLVGTGLIGGTLLDQLAQQQEILADRYKIRINLIGVANSKHMLFDAAGIEPARARDALLSRGEPMDLDGFISRMRAFNLPNSCFCDCTAADTVPSRYLDILKSSIPIVTPNKRANSGLLSYYTALTEYSRERGIPYLYETTVCAGLPVISTLHDLFLSGDRIRRIEAVVSGTLSYIFNNFDGTKPFSGLVWEAKQKGYTEPDPRDDLNAMDAARKVLILARECGMPLEFEAIRVEPILPPSCFTAPTVEAFFEELKNHDQSFEERRRRAAQQGKVLRYVAVIEEGKAELRLREEGEGSPFRSLVDADNMVVITTDRYSVLPMVIKGPGAGAQVTAAGVFADIVRIARTLV
ncbi:MAG TPA: bifunctional aspartate kinase/homoserine dehydrogenase I [Termitinemataceae bacterium]|nr:bifunctional aspartate kinase/homoserine dehydrogenase I [Termitinemataceae bacterium]HOM24554.1 bifunctional aspartate kinase/homoserine dehydrogenase I [Termitinemataceae bacterium]HPQ01654.1 bifunctional aspartate kinase/homoserine dehydrogenase I [Termitinemataceae bacterium]